ncbi:DUF294 nucleotidyltransferase-like domain-containing protein [Phyllobacterium sophorae]|uniref:Uncharacterized protein n=1 Tax=Phyllobacterium sophorae TaxID=1520277 RepID=A0A2P7B6Y2_9HYPH|nr:DUF294 nucleotidyltransferase-like domain-containing protein [Phyllobacterium sophorae]PSH62225.1 hypothetical protein CU103_20620 [Phyllobacterium sophorae]
MTVFAMLLFGSHARGDQDLRSDTDLLLITEDDGPRHVLQGHLSTSIYPLGDLQLRAQNGDLFVCHIIREAKPIYDPLEQLALLRSQFRIRSSYESEVQKATDLGWFLIDHGQNQRIAPLINRRVAWCVRTILISRSAEAGEPVFSASELAAFARSNAVMTMIKHKDAEHLDEEVVELLRGFLVKFGGLRLGDGRSSYGAYLKQFMVTSNNIALAFVKADAVVGIPY